MKVKVNFSSYLLNLFQVTVINHLWFLDDPKKTIFWLKAWTSSSFLRLKLVHESNLRMQICKP